MQPPCTLFVLAFQVALESRLMRLRDALLRRALDMPVLTPRQPFSGSSSAFAEQDTERVVEADGGHPGRAAFDLGPVGAAAVRSEVDLHRPAGAPRPGASLLQHELKAVVVAAAGRPEAGGRVGVDTGVEGVVLVPAGRVRAGARSCRSTCRRPPMA